MTTDHFSVVAAEYARSRPTYPDALFAWLAATAPTRALAWDVGAGSGQASVALAEHFDHVVATDLSAEQIGAAEPHPRIAYRVAPAERSGLEAASVDLVAVAQALHWFDLAPFYAEVRRVAKPGGLVAAWTYGILAVEGQQVDRIVDRYYRVTAGPHWPAERRHVENGYAELDFPFTRAPAPAFAIERDWTLGQLLGYVRSWSATARLQRASGSDPVSALEAELAPAWGDPAVRRRITWPITLHAGRT
jgi:SAM-dependent methyltransferase